MLTTNPVTVCLPIADRRRSHTFYTDGLGLDAIGPVADDGVPEPLQVVLNDGVRLMLIPTGGFAWTIAGHEVAPAGVAECQLSIVLATDDDVDALIEQARSAGAEIAGEPQRQPWGYAANFADPDGHLWMVVADPTG